MAWVGSDPDALDRVALHCRRAAQHLVAIERTVVSSGLHHVWHGPDAADVLAGMARSCRQLLRVSASLDDSAAVLARNAAEQRRASTASSGRSGDGGAEDVVLRSDPDNGELVWATGDPAGASNVVVFIPGTGTDLGDAERLQGRVRALVAEAGPGTVGIMWIGSDFPDTVLPSLGDFGNNALLKRFALDGAVALNGDVQALTLADDVRLTVIGHSYGAVIATEFSKQPAASLVDAWVLVASPGVDDLRVGDAEAYSMVGPGDPVPHLGAHGDIPLRYGSGLAPLSAVHSPEGGRPSSGHSGYLADGSASLDNLAAVVRGETLDGRRAGSPSDALLGAALGDLTEVSSIADTLERLVFGPVAVLGGRGEPPEPFSEVREVLGTALETVERTALHAALEYQAWLLRTFAD